MTHIPVKSANIVSVAHDPNTKEMEVKFSSGSTYRYNNVPPAMHQNLVKAPSIGSYFANHIKDKYTAVKV